MHSLALRHAWMRRLAANCVTCQAGMCLLDWSFRSWDQIWIQPSILFFFLPYFTSAFHVSFPIGNWASLFLLACDKNLRYAAVVKGLSPKWNQMTEGEKEPYKVQAAYDSGKVEELARTPLLSKSETDQRNFCDFSVFFF